MLENFATCRKAAEVVAGKDIVLVLGPTGSGKTTFINFMAERRMIAQNIKPGKMVYASQ